ncbi:hypothetical protein [Saccharothrix syringae]|uniref:HAF repeat-containing protein n=1 Tax=Saccharothrix syringae TaxID=103733 RepID=A0A5Q0GYF3_SACSY|nr:hypothetical protein [Saccharothrix syringae]QFZ18392.1 hypothetical protein EKG83_13665 [Saccharothrix syringae]
MSSALTVLVVLVLATPARAAVIGFEVLPPPAGWTFAEAQVVNEAGQVAGTAGVIGKRPVPGFLYGVRWDGTTPLVLGGGETGGQAYGINERGDVLFTSRFAHVGLSFISLLVWEDGRLVGRTPRGTSTNGPIGRDISDNGVVPLAHQRTAGAWRDGVYESVPLPPEGTYRDHVAVNRHGTTAGVGDLNDGTGSFVFRCSATECTRLPAAGAGGSYSVAAINDSGWVAGTWSVGSTTRAVLWADDRVTVLPGEDVTVSDSRRALNENGDVVGRRTVDGLSRAVLWRDGELIEFGLPDWSQAIAVNDRGDVVGWQESGGSPRGFHWRDGVVTTLPAPAGSPAWATDINNSGVVVGHSYSQAFRWTVP